METIERFVARTRGPVVPFVDEWYPWAYAHHYLRTEIENMPAELTPALLSQRVDLAISLIQRWCRATGEDLDEAVHLLADAYLERWGLAPPEPVSPVPVSPGSLEPDPDLKDELHDKLNGELHDELHDELNHELNLEPYTEAEPYAEAESYEEPEPYEDLEPYEEPKPVSPARDQYPDPDENPTAVIPVVRGPNDARDEVPAPLRTNDTANHRAARRAARSQLVTKF